MMKPHDQLTIVRNLHRARELRLFRELVVAYFERSERDESGVPLDWDGAQADRARINRMLPRIILSVRAAGLGGFAAPAAGASDPGPGLGRVEVLLRIFSARYGDGLDQEILDVLDMALGVYESGRVMAFLRTINPLHYVVAALAFTARVPGRFLAALGIRRSARARPGVSDPARVEALAARLAEAEELMDARLAAVMDRQALRQADYARELAELAERLDFAERMLARQELPKRLDAPNPRDVSTPV